MSSIGFYRALEERYRGSRDLIRKRLEAYRPFITPLLGIYQPAAAVDLGCGRGEWLELLQHEGFQSQGVDLDEGMLAACVERGLPAIQGDAIAYLRDLGDESQCIVSAFHVVEHIPFEDLETLVIQSLRVLKPGGLLILETPNPENLVVGTSNFYLDPTHLRPVPPLLLSFLPEHHGFARVHTVRLQESPELCARSDVGLMEVLGGVSPDYAIVAQKAAAPKLLANFDEAFATRYGIELQELAGRYDGKTERRISAIDHRLATAEAQMGGMTEALGGIASLHDRFIETTAQLARMQAEMERLRHEVTAITSQMAAKEAKSLATEARAWEQEQRANAAEARVLESQQHAHAIEVQLQQQARIDELSAHSHHWWQQACVLEAERNALRGSWSWRITMPLRWSLDLLTHPVQSLRNVANRTLYNAINILQRPLSRLMVVVMRDPRRSHRINNWLLTHFPALHGQLRDVGRLQGIVPGEPPPEEPEAPITFADLTPRARQIYIDLNTAIEKQQEGRAHEDSD